MMSADNINSSICLEKNGFNNRFREEQNMGVAVNGAAFSSNALGSATGVKTSNNVAERMKAARDNRNKRPKKNVPNSGQAGGKRKVSGSNQSNAWSTQPGSRDMCSPLPHRV